uniref:Uncharacterized protein n=1 Tax=Arion vulgaris TaxID=1028688 RepID=A0A0B6ZYR9_9EUPU
MGWPLVSGSLMNIMADRKHMQENTSPGPHKITSARACEYGEAMLPTRATLEQTPSPADLKFVGNSSGVYMKTPLKLAPIPSFPIIEKKVESILVTIVLPKVLSIVATNRPDPAVKNHPMITGFRPK